MHDSVLMNKISDSLGKLCREHNIRKVKRLSLIVDENSHINSTNLYEHLTETSEELVGEWTEIHVESEALDNQVAILHSIEGEKAEN